MLNRPEVINYFIKRFGYRRYLEIGVEAGNTFNAVEATAKFAVDPHFRIARDALRGESFAMTSDAFFNEHREEIFDIVFIDGLHTFEQSLRDFASAMACVSKTGVILVDDCNPSDYLASIRDHDLSRKLKEQQGVKDRNWMGDVYKTVLFINDHFGNVSLSYINDTMGIVAIWFEPRPVVPFFRSIEDIAHCDFADFRGKIFPNLPKRSLAEIGDSIFFCQKAGMSPST